MTIDVDTVLRVQTDTVLAQGVRAKLRTAMSSAKRGQWAAAERAFSYVIEQVPLHWEAYVGRGNMYQVRGDFERAIRDFTQAIRIAPDHAAPLWGRANARYLAGDLAGAIHDFDAVIARQNDVARAYERRGIVLQRLGREEAAEADFTRAIELGDGDRSVAYAHRAAVRALRGAIIDAALDCEVAMQLLPKRGRQHEATVRLYRTLVGDGTPSQVTPKRKSAKTKAPASKAAATKAATTHSEAVAPRAKAKHPAAKAAAKKATSPRKSR